MSVPPYPGWMDADAVAEALRTGDGAGVKIAILDSGIEMSHPALAGLELQDDVVIRESFGKLLIEAGDGTDLYGHGTAIASIIRRIAPGATLGSFRVLDARLGSRNHVIGEGIRLAIERGYHLLNCSFGCRDGEGRHMALYKKWVDAAYLRRVHLVTACSNLNVNIQEWPGSFSSCVNVNMAACPEETLAYREDHPVEFAAIGVGLDVPWTGGTRTTVSGSSFAAPVVAALLARILGAYPGLSSSQAKSLLQAHAAGWRNEWGM